MKLTDRFDDRIIFKGDVLHLDMAFDKVLRSFELWDDDKFTEVEKIEIFLEMFVTEKEKVKGLAYKEKVTLFNEVFGSFILNASDKKEQSNQGEISTIPNKKIYDINKDAEYIYASFLFDYNIDLFEQQGKLHWRKFQALLSNLSDKTKFKQVVSIRKEEIPTQTKYNQKERERLIELKRIYRLEGAETIQEIDAKFDHLASMLRPSGGENK
ncbi:Gp15 family bacteriophage protein [Thalassobacillus sp. C254]|uniref:Gp15 family bacteriophage protein n=1 Tax=Thalassobacillus sp. C254 TaxID=1225341 RepID=UPI0006D1DB29|nr:Gp15 family bacteriophage protein [Thalassobacillus sp. C254]